MSLFSRLGATSLMVREWTDAERELAVNQRRLGFKLGRGSLPKIATISQSLLKGIDNFIQNDFDRSIRAIVNADMCHCKNLGLTIRIAAKNAIIDYVMNRNTIV